jgi:hypothetical protein
MPATGSSVKQTECSSGPRNLFKLHFNVRPQAGERGSTAVDL